MIYALSGLFATVANVMLAGRLSSAGPQAAIAAIELDRVTSGAVVHLQGIPGTSAIETGLRSSTIEVVASSRWTSTAPRAWT